MTLRYYQKALPHEKAMAKLMNATVDEWIPFIEPSGRINMRRNPDFVETDEIKKLKDRADFTWALREIFS